MKIFEMFKSKNPDNSPKKEDSKDFSDALRLTDMKLSGNPQEKYQTGSIKAFHENATKNGEYTPYVEKVIQETKDNLDELYKQVEASKKATFGLSKEVTHPKEWQKEKEERYSDVA